MRKPVFIIILLLAISAAAQTSSPAPSENANAKKARAVLDAMIQKLGGEAYLSVQDMQQEGRTYAYYNGKPNSLGTLFWRSWKFPDKERTELTKQRDVAYIFNGNNGYEVSYKGTAATEPENLRDYIRRRDHSLENVLRVWLPDPKTALFYDGTAIAEQKHCDAVTVMNAQADSVTIYVDSSTHLPVKKTFQWRDRNDKLKNEEGEIYDNFRIVQGVLTPHTLLRTRNGDTTNQRFLTLVKYNVGLPDSLFEATVTYDPYKHSGPRP